MSVPGADVTKHIPLVYRNRAIMMVGAVFITRPAFLSRSS
jgi:hypothetical protein